MSFIRKILCAFVLAPVCVIANPAADQLNALLSDIVTMQADYKQTTVDPKLKKEQHLTGTVLLKRPKQFRWQVTSPYEQLLVADGEKLWIYDKDLDQVTVQALGQSLQDTPALLIVGEHQDIEKHFSVTEKTSQPLVKTFQLISKDSENLLASAQITFQGSAIKGMRLIDNLDQVLDIEFMNVIQNQALPEDLFRFVPPPGVDVIGE